MQENVLELDVRPLLSAGRSPLPLIMNTVESLDEGQSLRLISAWEPIPLYELLGSLGFEHDSRQKSEDLWEIHFKRTSAGGGQAPGFEPPCIL